MPGKPKKNNEETEVSKLGASMVVHTIGCNKYEIRLGEIDAEQVQALNQTIVSAFGTIQQTKDFVITDFSGITYHFNVDNVECVRVKVE
jgi:hypothetical protein